MKWYSITKDGLSVFVVNKMKNLNINSKDECIKFIHKKNPNKGKFQSIVIDRVARDAAHEDWIIYYTQPLNKNHVDTEWKLKYNNDAISVYNGIVIIRTGVENNGDYPKILDSVDINDTDNLIKLQYSDDTVVDDDEQADDGDSDDGLLDDAAGVVTDDDAEHGDDFEDSDEEVAAAQTRTADVSAKTIELKDDLIVKELLQYEAYDYDAPLIPQYSI
tara:strand:- start:813 stop:1466 length:654 start_codon:yes stop_codon:yes gene_type:complete